MGNRRSERAWIAAALALAASPALALALGLWDPYWRAVTNLGDEPAYIALSILLYALHSPDLGFHALLALATSGWLSVLLKNALALPRPPRELWKVEASGYGFPSGHAQTSAAFWSAVALGLRSAGLAAFGAVLVALVSYSRLELMVHYPRDVVGGAALGLASALAVSKALGAWRGWSPRAKSASLAAYGAAVSLLYLVQGDLMHVRLGGVLLGLSAYPLVRPRLPERAPPPARALSAAAALALAVALTRAASPLGPPLQLAAYAAATASVLAAPLALKAAKLI